MCVMSVWFIFACSENMPKMHLGTLDAYHHKHSSSKNKHFKPIHTHTHAHVANPLISKTCIYLRSMTLKCKCCAIEHLVNIPRYEGTSTLKKQKKKQTTKTTTTTTIKFLLIEIRIMITNLTYRQVTIKLKPTNSHTFCESAVIELVVWFAFCFYVIEHHNFVGQISVLLPHTDSQECTKDCQMMHKQFQLRSLHSHIDWSNAMLNQKKK